MGQVTEQVQIDGAHYRATEHYGDDHRSREAYLLGWQESREALHDRKARNGLMYTVADHSVVKHDEYHNIDICETCGVEITEAYAVADHLAEEIAYYLSSKEGGAVK